MPPPWRTPRRTTSRCSFRKYRDWANEAEYRLVLLDQSLLPAYIDIRGALTAVVLGDAFPGGRLPALKETLNAYPDIEVQRLRFQNRSFHCFGGLKLEAAAKATPWAEPRRSGSLEERLDALLQATAEAIQFGDEAKLLAAEHLAVIQVSVAALCSELRSWPEVDSTMLQRVLAVPEEQRSRRPGVSGERVHHEDGFMCVVENLPKPSLTLVAAAAVQVLDDQRLRLHAVVTTEQWRPEGNIRAEHWRAAHVVPAEEAAAVLSDLLAELWTEVDAVRPAFDERRGQTSYEAS